MLSQRYRVGSYFPFSWKCQRRRTDPVIDIIKTGNLPFYLQKKQPPLLLPPQMQDKIKIQIIALQQLLSLPPHPLLLPKNPLLLLPHPPQQNKRIIIHNQLLFPPRLLLSHELQLLLHPQEDKSPIVASIYLIYSICYGVGMTMFPGNIK